MRIYTWLQKVKNSLQTIIQWTRERNLRFPLPPNFMINCNKSENGSVLELPLWLHVGWSLVMPWFMGFLHDDISALHLTANNGVRTVGKRRRLFPISSLFAAVSAR